MNQLKLTGKDMRIMVNEDVSLSVFRRDDTLLWQSSRSYIPALVIRSNDRKIYNLPLADASKVSVAEYDDGKYSGHTLRLSDFAGTDIILELIFAIDTKVDELMLQVAQAGGSDTVVSVEHFYRLEKPVANGGYMVLPHGSGYLIPAECPDELPGKGPKGGFIGARWTLPVFGMVRGNDAICAIVETWWDCEVEANHAPGKQSALDFHWRGSLGKLEYARCFYLRFTEGMDYVAMARLYRRYAREHGLLQTLEEKAVQTPVIRRYIQNILLRWPAWNIEDGPAVLENIHKLQGMGFGINFFFPKWSSEGYSSERNTATTANCSWQAYLHPNPVPGGWGSLVKFANSVRQSNCTVQGFINPRSQYPDGPEFDEARWPCDADGQRIHDLSTHDALDRIKWVLDNIEEKGLKLDVLYFDGFSAHSGLEEDFSSHPVSRRQTFEAQNACFAETRRRGIMPGGELARFWCIANCDYFFFTDWSSDRLSNAPVQGAPAPVGEPIPLFQLVFHDCYIAGFSSGGYSLYAPGDDWWAEYTPRLYEFLFTSAPAHNWLPEGYVPVRDWNSPKTQRRWGWLRRWSTYYRAVAMFEMLSHEFLSADRKQQRIRFANGVVAEFDMATNRLRVSGVAGFTGEWERPEEF